MFSCYVKLQAILNNMMNDHAVKVYGTSFLSLTILISTVKLHVMLD